MRLPFLSVRTRSPEETVALGRQIGQIVRPGEVILLTGDLGTGKTTFVRGLGEGLGVPSRPRSPTFTMVHHYRGGRFPLVHVDLYRLENSVEVETLGLEELFEPPAVAVVEWGEKAAGVAGEHYLELEFSWEEEEEDDVRTIRFLPLGRWTERMGELSEAVRAWASSGSH